MTTFTHLLRAEWTKLRSLRSTVWSLGVMVVLTLGIGILATRLFAGNFDKLDPSDQAHLLADPIGLILQPGAEYAQIAVCVLGAMLMTGEYSSGTISAGLLAVPIRLPLLAAKAGVFAAVVFVLSELIAIPTFFAGRAALRPHVELAIGDPGVVRALAGLGLYMALTGLFALAVGALIRHVAGAVAATLGITVLASGLSGLLPGSVGEHVEAWMPANAGEQILSSGHDPGALLSPWQGIGVLGLESAVLLVLAGWLLLRRDA